MNRYFDYKVGKYYGLSNGKAFICTHLVETVHSKFPAKIGGEWYNREGENNNSKIRVVKEFARKPRDKKLKGIPFDMVKACDGWPIEYRNGEKAYHIGFSRNGNFIVEDEKGHITIHDDKGVRLKWESCPKYHLVMAE